MQIDQDDEMRGSKVRKTMLQKLLRGMYFYETRLL